MLSIFVRAAAVLDDRNSRSRRQLPDCRREIDMLVFHDETKNAPADAAAETMKGLPLRTDMKRWRLFLMKWAERSEIRAGPFQGKIGADDFHDVVRGGDLLDCFRRNHVGRLFFSRLLVEAMPKFTQRQSA